MRRFRSAISLSKSLAVTKDLLYFSSAVRRSRKLRWHPKARPRAQPANDKELPDGEKKNGCNNGLGLLGFGHQNKNPACNCKAGKHCKNQNAWPTTHLLITANYPR